MYDTMMMTILTRCAATETIAPDNDIILLALLSTLTRQLALIGVSDDLLENDKIVETSEMSRDKQFVDMEAHSGHQWATLL